MSLSALNKHRVRRSVHLFIQRLQLLWCRWSIL